MELVCLGNVPMIWRLTDQINFKYILLSKILLLSFYQAISLIKIRFNFDKIRFISKNLGHLRNILFRLGYIFTISTLYCLNSSSSLSINVNIAILIFNFTPKLILFNVVSVHLCERT